MKKNERMIRGSEIILAIVSKLDGKNVVAAYCDDKEDKNLYYITNYTKDTKIEGKEYVWHISSFYFNQEIAHTQSSLNLDYINAFQVVLHTQIDAFYESIRDEVERNLLLEHAVALTGAMSDFEY